MEALRIRPAKNTILIMFESASWPVRASQTERVPGELLAVTRPAFRPAGFCGEPIRNAHAVMYCTDEKPFIPLPVPSRGVTLTHRSCDPRCGARRLGRLPRGHGLPGPSGVGARPWAVPALGCGIERVDGHGPRKHTIRTRELPHGRAHVAGPRATACLAPFDPIHHDRDPGRPPSWPRS